MRGMMWLAGGIFALGFSGPAAMRPQQPPPKPPKPPVVVELPEVERIGLEALEMARESLRGIDLETLQWQALDELDRLDWERLQAEWEQLDWQRYQDEWARQQDELQWQLHDFDFQYDFDYDFDYDCSKRTKCQSS
jgi:hypothetical protein